MTNQPLTITIVSSPAIYGYGYEHFYYNDDFAYSASTGGEGGEWTQGATTSLIHLIDLGLLDATIKRVSIEHAWSYFGPEHAHLHWVMEKSGKLEFYSLASLLEAAAKDKDLMVTWED